MITQLHFEYKKKKKKKKKKMLLLDESMDIYKCCDEIEIRPDMTTDYSFHLKIDVASFCRLLFIRSILNL